VLFRALHLRPDHEEVQHREHRDDEENAFHAASGRSRRGLRPRFFDQHVRTSS
jgi:hypothetical protein